MVSSVSVSMDEKQSSSRIIDGFLIKALAIEILCTCPPDSVIPLSPSIVSYPYFNFCISLSIEALIAAISISLIEALFLPNLILLVIDSEKRKGFCGTYPMFFLSSFSLNDFKFSPSIRISPMFGS